MNPDVGAVAVKSATGWWTATGIWVGIIMAIAGIITSIIKQWGPWKRVASDDRAADFARLREEAKEAKDDAKEALVAVHRLENAVACLRPAVTILMAEVRRLDPDPTSNAALIQVQELLAMAAGSDFGVTHAMKGLAMMRGVGE